MPALILTLAAAVYLSAALLILGSRKPAYSHRRQTISELGESGAPQAGLVAAGVFLPIGLAMLVTAWLARPLGSGLPRSRSVSPSATSRRRHFPATRVRPCQAAGARPCITWAAPSSTAVAQRSCCRWPDRRDNLSGPSDYA
jgi:hypothetical protein